MTVADDVVDVLKLAGSTTLAAGVVVTVAAPDSVAGRLMYTGCFAGLVVVAWLGVRRPAAGGRTPWVMIASGVTSWLAGDLVWAGLALGGHPPAVGPPDVLWLAGYPLVGAGLIAMVRRRAPGQALAGLQDGLTLSTAAALATWQYLVAPGLDASDSTLDVVVQALYPLGDIMLLASVLFLMFSPGRNGPATRLLVTGTVLTLVTDIALTVLNGHWSDTDLERLDGFLLVANAMIVAAIIRRDRDELVTPVRVPVTTLHPARVLFLGLAVLTAPLMAVTTGKMDMDVRIVIMAGTTITIAFSLARFTGAVREQTRVQQLLTRLADHDSLTGLANRRVFTERLDREFVPVEDTVILYIDLDGFKAVNDRYGHAAGDAVLVEVARRLTAGVRAGDLIARLGGDEFAVLCAGLDPADGRDLADRLAVAVRAPIVVDGQEMSVGASVGVASAAGCVNGDALIARADHAMFDVKQSGRRQRVHV